jgi:FkbM family methyltransferase
MVVAVRGRRPVAGRISGSLTNGLVFDFDNASDAAISAFVHLQYVEPALAPVLEACLAKGGCFYDVGANVGLYSLWASRIVGPEGCVVAVEPVPATKALLESFARANRVSNIQVLQHGAGSGVTDAWVDIDAEDSAQANVVTAPSNSSVRISVVPLDQLTTNFRRPDLVKIDVEGLELQVLQGGTRTWRRDRPIIVLEAIPRHLERAGTSFGELRNFLEHFNYGLFDLTPRGLVRSADDRSTTNVLALSDDEASHTRAKEALSRTRFARNQTL